MPFNRQKWLMLASFVGIGLITLLITVYGWRGAHNGALVARWGTMLAIVAFILGWVIRTTVYPMPGTAGDQFVTICFGLGLFMVIQLFSIPWGNALYEQDRQAAQAYFDELVHDLQAYQVETGWYPESLEELRDPDERPTLISDGSIDAYYETFGRASFNLCMPRYNNQSNPLYDAYVYSSATRRWEIRASSLPQDGSECDLNWN